MLSVIILIVGIMLFMPAAQVYSIPIYSPIIVDFGDSPAVQTATNILKEYMPNAIVIDYSQIHDLNSLLTIPRAHSHLIVVGYGTDQGIMTKGGSILSWNYIANWINDLPSTRVDFLSCNSSVATSLINVHSIGFTNVVDAKLGAYWILMGENLPANLLYQVLDNAMIRISEIITTKKELGLGLVSGAAQVGVKFSYNYHIGGCITWPIYSCWKDVEENVMWFNLAHSTMNDLILGVTIFGVVGILAGAWNYWNNLPYQPANLGEFYLGLQMVAGYIQYKVGDFLDGIKITNVLFGFLALIFILVCITSAYSVLTQNSSDRASNGYDDYLIGVGARYAIAQSYDFVSCKKSDCGDGHSDLAFYSFPINAAIAMALLAIPGADVVLSIVAAILYFSPIALATFFNLVAIYAGGNWIDF